MTFGKYDLSPLGRSEYQENAAFLVEAYRSNTPLQFRKYFQKLEPRVLDGIVENSSISRDATLEVEENDLSTIGKSLLENIGDENPHVDEFFNSPDLFEEYYEKTSWEPDMKIMDSSELEHYKLESPYHEKIRELDRKSAINRGRQLPTFFGWAAGIPAAFETGSPIIAGGGAGFLIGYTVSKAQASRYESRARGIEKKIEDTVYEELAEKHLQEFENFEVKILEN